MDSDKKKLPTLEEYLSQQTGEKVTFKHTPPTTVEAEPEGILERLKHGIQEAAETIVDTAKEKVHEVTEVIGSVTHSVVGMATHMKENVQETVNAASDKVGEATGSLKETTQENTQLAQEKLEDVQRRLHESYEKVVSTALEKAHQVQESVSNVVGAAKEQAAQVAQFATTGAEVHQVAETTKEGKHPAVEIDQQIPQAPTLPPTFFKSHTSSPVKLKIKPTTTIPQEKSGEEIKEELPSLEGGVIPTAKVPVIPTEALDQPTVVAKDLPHDWKPTAATTTASTTTTTATTTTNAWTDPTKTHQIVESLAKETEQTEQQIKQALQEARASEPIHAGRK